MYMFVFLPDVVGEKPRSLQLNLQEVGDSKSAGGGHQLNHFFSGALGRLWLSGLEVLQLRSLRERRAII